MATWNENFNDAPVGSNTPSVLDDKIRETRTGIGERMKNEHTTYEGDGTLGVAALDFIHKKGSAVLYAQATAPTIPSGIKAARDGLLWWDTTNEALKYYKASTEAWVTICEKEPIGTIQLFSGTWTDNVTKVGWYKCDEDNERLHGTPNLVDKFIVGATTSGAGNTDNAISGGAVSVTIAEANLPAHTHTIAHTHFIANTDEDTEIAGTNVLGSTTYMAYSWNRVLNERDYLLKGTSTDPTIGLTSASSAENSGSTGSGTALNVTPPYYKLIYIMRIS